MTDNELFNHFKTQSAAIEEVAGDDLWAKIESELNDTKPTRSFNILLFVACGILVTALTIWYFTTTESVAKIKPAIEPAATTVPKPKNIAPYKPQPQILPPPSATDEKTTSAQASVILHNTETVVITAQDSVKKLTVRTAKIKTASMTEKTIAEPYVKFMSYSKGAVAPLQESLTFEVQKKETSGNIIITTKQKITADEYNKLIEDMLKENEPSVGNVLIIKAPGHKTFRKVIGMETAKGIIKTNNVDSIIINPIRVEQLNPTLSQEKLQVNSSYINPETISFDRITTTPNDSLPKGNNNLKE